VTDETPVKRQGRPPKEDREKVAEVVVAVRLTPQQYAQYLAACLKFEKNSSDFLKMLLSEHVQFPE
jgi:hypothetical protein